MSRANQPVARTTAAAATIWEIDGADQCSAARVQTAP